MHKASKQAEIKTELIGAIDRVAKLIKESEIATRLAIAGAMENTLTQLIATELSGRSSSGYYHSQRGVTLCDKSTIRIDLAHMKGRFDSSIDAKVDFAIEAKHTLTSQPWSWISGNIYIAIKDREESLSKQADVFNESLYVLYFLTEITSVNPERLELVHNDFVKSLSPKRIGSVHKHVFKTLDAIPDKATKGVNYFPYSSVSDSIKKSLEFYDASYDEKEFYRLLETPNWSDFSCRIHVFVLGAVPLSTYNKGRYYVNPPKSIRKSRI